MLQDHLINARQTLDDPHLASTSKWRPHPTSTFTHTHTKVTELFLYSCWSDPILGKSLAEPSNRRNLILAKVSLLCQSLAELMDLSGVTCHKTNWFYESVLAKLAIWPCRVSLSGMTKSATITMTPCQSTIYLSRLTNGHESGKNGLAGSNKA